MCAFIWTVMTSYLVLLLIEGGRWLTLAGCLSLDDSEARLYTQCSFEIDHHEYWICRQVDTPSSDSRFTESVLLTSVWRQDVLSI